MLGGRTAIITGASAGLGAEISRQFARAGANLVMIARKVEALEALAEEIGGVAGVEIVTFAADVSDENRMKTVIGESIERFGKIEILVNNAGVYGPKGRIEETDFNEWKRAVEINLYGVFIATKHLVGHFKANGYGKIINLSGGGATKPMPMFSSYAASKAAVVRLSDTIAREVSDYGIDVNSIAPGALNTRLLDEVLAAGPERVGEDFYRNSLKQKESGGAPLKVFILHSP